MSWLIAVDYVDKCYTQDKKLEFCFKRKSIFLLNLATYLLLPPEIDYQTIIFQFNSVLY